MVSSKTVSGFEYTILSDESLSVVCTDHSLYPRVTDDAGEEVEDAGNIEWPSDATIAKVASELLGRKVRVKFSDAGDHREHSESIYSLAKTPESAP